MRDLQWSAAEKRIARRAFDAALGKALTGILATFKAKAAAAASPSDMWAVEDYLRQRRREIDDVFDYRYSRLVLVLARLIRDGHLDEAQLAGLGEDKLAAIRRLRLLSENAPGDRRALSPGSRITATDVDEGGSRDPGWLLPAQSGSCAAKRGAGGRVDRLSRRLEPIDQPATGRPGRKVGAVDGGQWDRRSPFRVLQRQRDERAAGEIGFDQVSRHAAPAEP